MVDLRVAATRSAPVSVGSKAPGKAAAGLAGRSAPAFGQWPGKAREIIREITWTCRINRRERPLRASILEPDQRGRGPVRASVTARTISDTVLFLWRSRRGGCRGARR